MPIRMIPARALRAVEVIRSESSVEIVASQGIKQMFADHPKMGTVPVGLKINARNVSRP